MIVAAELHDMLQVDDECAAGGEIYGVGSDFERQLP